MLRFNRVHNNYFREVYTTRMEAYGDPRDFKEEAVVNTALTTLYHETGSHTTSMFNPDLRRGQQPIIVVNVLVRMTEPLNHGMLGYPQNAEGELKSKSSKKDNNDLLLLM